MPSQIHFENPRGSRCALRRGTLSIFIVFIISFFCAVVVKGAVGAPAITSITPTTAVAGQQVTITGTNFGTTAAAVSFGSIWQEEISSWSNTQIVAPVPVNAQSGAVSVATAAYAQISNSVNLTVVYASITSISPTTAVVGQQVTITGTNFGPTGGAVSFGNLWQQGMISWSNTQIVAAVPVNAQSGGVSVITSGFAQSNSVNLTVTGAAAGLSPSSLTFTSQAVGGTSAARAITLNNTGNAALSLTSIALTGANPGDFAQTNTCGTSVAAGASCSISVTFDPTASGNRSASVSFTDNAGGSPQSLSLGGTGTSATVSLSPSSLSFTNQPISLTSSTQIVTLTNGGSTAVSISSLTFTGTNAADFAEVADTCGSSVAAGANCSISVDFTPSTASSESASLAIADNATGSPQTVSLSGSGIHDVGLSWTPSTTSGVVGYNVYRGTTSGGESSTPLNSTPVTGATFTDQSVTAGTTYYYVVTAVGSNDTQSPASGESSTMVPTT